MQINAHNTLMLDAKAPQSLGSHLSTAADKQYIKRAFDIFFSTLALITLSPLFLIIFIAQKLTSKEPAFFLQERIGLGGKPFFIYKFRSMREDAEENGPQLTNEKEANKYTRIGHFLRRHHLDELPQLWNVLKGDMSFVGYRPERQFFIDQILENDPRYVQLYRMRPGITSEAAIYNGYTDTMEKMLLRLEMDLKYLEKSSLTTDITILIKTLCVIF